MTRRNFLKIGALFVPAVAAPTIAYSFLTGGASNALVGLGNDDHLQYYNRRDGDLCLTKSMGRLQQWVFSARTGSWELMVCFA